LDVVPDESTVLVQFPLLLLLLLEFLFPVDVFEAVEGLLVLLPLAVFVVALLLPEVDCPVVEGGRYQMPARPPTGALVMGLSADNPAGPRFMSFRISSILRWRSAALP